MIVKLTALLQPATSVTVHVQTPAVRPETEIVPSPVGFPGVQLYVYPPAPPVAVLTEAIPVAPP